MPRRSIVIAALALCGCILAPSPASACQIPVFRYALERWAAEPYEVVVFHPGPLAPPDKQLLARLEEAGKASTNVTVVEADLASDLPDELRLLWKTQGEAARDAKAPWLVVRRTEEGEDGLPPAWAGKLDAANVAALLDSPARREVAKQILAGQAVVFVLVESGDKPADDRAAKAVEEQIRRLEKTLALPEINPAEPGPRVLSTLPLKMAFSVVRVSRADPAEGPFAAMLLQGLIPAQPPKSAKAKAAAAPVAVKPVAPKGPVLVPVFGQGRALCALEGQDISAKNLEDVARFLTSACSCQVKQLNPGYDLLVKAEWRSILDDPEAAHEEAARVREPRSKVPDPVIAPGNKGLKPRPATQPTRR